MNTLFLILFFALVSTACSSDDDGPITLDPVDQGMEQDLAAEDLSQPDMDGTDADSMPDEGVDAEPDLDPSTLPDLVVNFVDVIPDPDTPGGRALNFTGANRGNVPVEIEICVWTLRRAGEDAVVQTDRVDDIVLYEGPPFGPGAMIEGYSPIDLDPSPGPDRVAAEMTVRCDPPEGVVELDTDNNEFTGEFQW